MLVISERGCLPEAANAGEGRNIYIYGCFVHLLLQSIISPDIGDTEIIAGNTLSL